MSRAYIVQEKQSPVNELLKKADHLIATQNTQPEVYAAMADSLGLAWKDVNDILQKRSYLLHLNVEYHRYKLIGVILLIRRGIYRSYNMLTVLLAYILYYNIMA